MVRQFASFFALTATFSMYTGRIFYVFDSITRGELAWLLGIGVFLGMMCLTSGLLMVATHIKTH